MEKTVLLNLIYGIRFINLMVKNFVKEKVSRLMHEVQTAIHLFYYNLFDVMDWKLIMMSCKVSNV